MFRGEVKCYTGSNRPHLEFYRTFGRCSNHGTNIFLVRLGWRPHAVGIGFAFREKIIMVKVTDLIDIRLRAGLSQYQLARILRLNRGYVSHIEQGKITISPDVAERWMKIQERGQLSTLTCELVIANCFRCGEPMFENPPQSGLIVPCPCGPPLGKPPPNPYPESPYGRPNPRQS